MRKFRLLTADEIECRINQITEKGCGLLLYKTARTDYALLDEEVGMYRWQNDYKVIDGKMYCGIGIYEENTKTWIWKWNCGVETYTEAEKGQASDAMKRAGFCWGIGTELYSAPFIWIPTESLLKHGKTTQGKWVVKDSFKVSKIAYDKDENISELIITNQIGKIVYSYNGTSNMKTEPKAEQEMKPAPKPTGTISNICSECGAEVAPVVMEYSKRKYGYCLCRDCQKKYGSQ